MEVRKLAAPERQKAVYHYTVEGKGSFPIDMLRYDAAYPAREEDSYQIAYDERGLRKVNLTSYFAPTPGRWESFMWRVLS